MDHFPKKGGDLLKQHFAWGNQFADAYLNVVTVRKPVGSFKTNNDFGLGFLEVSHFYSFLLVSTGSF